MPRALLAAFLILALGASAQAAPSAASKQGATPAPAHAYWLSDGLNRLVFWKAPAASLAGTRSTR